MPEELLQNDSDLDAFRNILLTASDQLLDDRNAAAAAGQSDKVKVAEEEFDRIAVVLATVQGVINRREALRIKAVADRLEQSIQAQKAIGLSLALKTLQDAVSRLRAGGGFSSVGVDTEPAATGDLRPKPGPHADVVGQLIAGASAAGLDPMLVLTIVAIESDFDPSATSPLSSAGGLFQFIDSTWVAEGGPKIGTGGKGSGFAASASVDLQVKIGCAFIAEIIQTLTSRLNRQPSAVAVYMAHQQGIGGAIKILQADAADAIESVIGADAAHNNRFDGLTVAQTIAKFNTMVRVNEAEARALVTDSRVAPPVAGTDGGGNGFAMRVVHVALAEMEQFARRDGDIVFETQSPLAARVLEYFRLVGRPDITDPASEPWSAAFISFVMNKAGAPPAAFPISQNHSRYILAGLANRVANRENASIVYFDRNEIAPRIGDLVGFSRTASVRDRADLERLLPDTFFPSHTDLVVDVSPGKIKVIGGNVSQTILTGTIATDPSGKMSPTDKHFFVLRLNI